MENLNICIKSQQPSFINASDVALESALTQREKKNINYTINFYFRKKVFSFPKVDCSVLEISLTVAESS